MLQLYDVKQPEEYREESKTQIAPVKTGHL